MILIILGGLLLALCLFAAFHDVNSLTIPNWLNLALAVLFVPAAVFSGLPLEIIFGHVLAGLAAFVIAFGLFAFRIFGGGDAKMILLLCSGSVRQPSLEFVFTMRFVGGACALIIVLVRNTVPAAVLPGPIRAPFEEKAGVALWCRDCCRGFRGQPGLPIPYPNLNGSGSNRLTLL